jgi:hypothetical protein
LAQHARPAQEYIGRVRISLNDVKDNVRVARGLNDQADFLEPLAKDFPNLGSPGNGLQLLIDGLQPNVVFEPFWWVMNKNFKYLKLVGSIERWMESGNPEISLQYLLDASDNDLEYISTQLCKWKNEGKIEWLLTLDLNQVNKSVVRFSHYITKHIPWRNEI